MPYQPLTREQFDKAVAAGFTPQQITQNELRRKTEIEAAETPKKDALDVAADVGNFLFPGTKQIGESLVKAGTNVANLATGGMEKFNAGLSENTVDVPALAGAYTAAGASVAGTAGAGAGGGLLRRALSAAGLGAAMGGGAEAAEGGSAEQVLGAAATGAATGAAVSGAFSGVGAIGKQINQLPERFVRAATGQTKRQLAAGQDVSRYVIENKKIGTANKLIDDAQAAIDKASSIIKENLKTSNKTVAIDDVFDSLSKTDSAINAQYSIDDLKGLIQQVAPQSKKLINKGVVSLEEANDLRQLLDKTIGDRGFLATQQTLNKEFLKEFAGQLRERVKSNAPEGTRAAFNTLSNEIRLRNALIDKSLRRGGDNFPITWKDLLSGGVGSVAGGPTGAIAGAAAQRVLSSTPFLTGAAVTIDRLDTALSPVLEQLQPAAQTAIINALAQALSPQK